MNFDEDYNGKTLLKDWWGKVKNNFSYLKQKLEQEISDREFAIEKEEHARNLKIAEEVGSAREACHAAISEAVAEEASQREAADTELTQTKVDKIDGCGLVSVGDKALGISKPGSTAITEKTWEFLRVWWYEYNGKKQYTEVTIPAYVSDLKDSSDYAKTSAIDKLKTDKADKQTANGGFIGGSEAISYSGGAVGSEANTNDGGAIGSKAYSYSGGAVGSEATAGNGGAIGKNAKASSGFAGGENAQTVSGNNIAIDAIQLGTGTNPNEYTMQVYDYQLLADDAVDKSATDGGKYLKDVGKLSDLCVADRDNIVSAINSLIPAINDIQLKQDILTFDSEPTYNSDNPVTSGGVYDELESIRHGISDSMNGIGIDIGQLTLSLDDKVDKVDGKGLSANDYTNEEKSKLTDLPTKTELDGNFEGKQDKLTFDEYPMENSDNPVKSGGLYTRLVSLSESVADALADGIYCEELIGELKQKSIPHADVTGYPITLSDHLSGEEFTKFNVHGCKNLIPYPYVNTTKTVNGVTLTDNGDGSITVNGTPTASISYYLGQTPVTPSTSYILSGIEIGKNLAFMLLEYDKSGSKIGQTNSRSISYTASSNAAYVRIYLDRVNSGTEIQETTVKPQLELGTAATSFEVNKKIGTLDSESGKYKIPIVQRGKNLFDISKVTSFVHIDYTTSRNTYSTISDGIVTSKIGLYANGAIWKDTKIKLPAGTYTLSADCMADKDTGNKNVAVYVYNLTLGKRQGKTHILSSYRTWERLSSEIVLEEESEVAVLIQGTGVKDDYTDLQIKIKNVQLEIGSSATEYEPYREKAVTAFLDSALGADEYINLVNKKRYNADTVTDIPVTGNLTLLDSESITITCSSEVSPSKMEVTYYQDINKVIEELKNAILSQGGNV